MYITITTPQTPINTQISITELFNQTNTIPNNTIQYNTKTITTETDTYWKEKYTKNFKSHIDYQIKCLALTAKTKFTKAPNMSEYYEKPFFIPKRNDKLRRIDAPTEPLMIYLRSVKYFLENICHCNAHNNAYAYIKHRNPKKCATQHMTHKYFLKLDLKHFFPSCTKELVITQLKKIYPINYSIQENQKEWETVLQTAFLNNSLPQGTPLSPTLSNIIMIPFDFNITNILKSQDITYTRYADDIFLSSNKPIHAQYIIKIIEDVLRKNEYTFTINKEKTRMGTNNGKNWMLGLMINNQHNITVGHRRKKKFKALLYNFAKDLTNDTHWSIIELQSLLGEYSYIASIEPNTINAIIETYNTKFNFNTINKLKQELKNQ